MTFLLRKFTSYLLFLEHFEWERRLLNLILILTKVLTKRQQKLPEHRPFETPGGFNDKSNQKLIKKMKQISLKLYLATGFKVISPSYLLGILL